MEDVYSRLRSSHLLRGDAKTARVKKALSQGILHEITEYGRPVHAEMEALLSCARNGVSPVGATLYTITFPCHNCAKHIIASGVSRVVYIEPYPKSKALELHSDAIALEEGDREGRVIFAPFIGIGPRRFVELFSLEPGPGRKIERNIKGEIVKWEGSKAQLRAPMQVADYMQLELWAAALTSNKRRKSSAKGKRK